MGARIGSRLQRPCRRAHKARRKMRRQGSATNPVSHRGTMSPSNVRSRAMNAHALLAAACIALAGGAFAAEYETQIRDRTHACKSPGETYKFWSLARRDKEAAAKYSNERGCLMIPAGVTVEVVERDPVAKINGIRLKGEKTVYYVPASDAK